MHCHRQSYEIKSPPWTIWWFRILGIFSVENIDRMDSMMFQTSDNSQLDLQYSSQQLTIFWSLIHHGTQPILILSRVGVLHQDRLKKGTWLHSFVQLVHPFIPTTIRTGSQLVIYKWFICPLFCFVMTLAVKNIPNYGQRQLVIYFSETQSITKWKISPYLSTPRVASWFFQHLLYSIAPDLSLHSRLVCLGGSACFMK